MVAEQNGNGLHKNKQEFSMTPKTKIRKKKKGCCCNLKVVIGLLIPIGILIAVAGLFLPPIFPRSLKAKLVLAKGTKSYEKWRGPSSKGHMRFYLFNYTNVEDIINNQATPRVDQVGPYIYRQIRVKDILEYNENNITYASRNTFIYEPELSCETCSENDTVFIPSLSFITLVNIIGGKEEPGWLKRNTINMFINSLPPQSLELFKEVTVGGAIWGYEDHLLDALRKLGPLLSMTGLKLPTSTKIALQKNATSKGNMTLLTGFENIDDVQRIVRWNGLDNTPFWLTEYGNMINGSDGSRTPPFLERDFKYYIFVHSLCRSLCFEYEKDVNVHGILMYRFSPTAMLFANETANPDNAAFCTDEDTCWDSGLLPMSNCIKGNPPIFMSWPHFYEGDPALVERIHGLNPDCNLHKNFLDVEPTTGITMRAFRRLQMNVMVQRSDWFEYSHIMQNKYNFLPILFIETMGGIDAPVAAKFRKAVYTPQVILGYGYYVLLALGGCLIVIALILTFVVIYREINQTKEEYSMVSLGEKPSMVIDGNIGKKLAGYSPESNL